MKQREEKVGFKLTKMKTYVNYKRQIWRKGSFSKDVTFPVEGP